MRHTTHRLGNALRVCAAAAVLALFSGCGDVPADEADDVTTKVSALDPCQQCQTRYTNCFQDYSDSARACANQRDICVNNQC